MPPVENKEKILIRGAEWDRSYVEEAIAYCVTRSWTRQTWFARDALVHRNGGSSSLYIGQKYDPMKIDLVPGGWNHDHCTICFWDLFESDDPEHAVGFTDRDDWLCRECYEKLIAPAQARSN